MNRLAWLISVVWLSMPVAAGAAGEDSCECLGSREILFVGESGYAMYVDKRTPLARNRGLSVIFLHGAGHTGLYWEKTPDNRDGFAPAFLRAGYTVYVVDLPGHGRSPTPIDLTDPHTGLKQIVFPSTGLDRAVSAVRQLIVEDANATVLIGHSMAGQIVDRVLAGASEQVRANVRGAMLLAPVPPPELVKGGAELPETGVFFIEPSSAQMMLANSPAFPRESLENYLRSLWRVSPRHANEFMVAGRVAPVGKEIYRDIPAIVVAAELDGAVPLGGQQARADYFGIPLVLLGRDWKQPDHGHMFMIERGSEEIAARLLRWLEENLSESGEEEAN